MAIDPKRGDIWLVELDPVQGQEMQKKRPCVVVSSDGLRKRQIRTIVPITTWQEKFWEDSLKVPLNPTTSNGLDNESAADALQPRTVALERFRDYFGYVTADELEAIVLAIGEVIEHP
jgi:mRNA interferase MazF